MVKWTCAQVGALILLFCAIYTGAWAEELPLAIRLNRSTANIGVDSVNRAAELCIAAADYASGTGSIPQTVSWTASDLELITLTPMAGDPSKCTVTSTAAKAGSCTVTAKVGSAAASCVVTVRSVFKAQTLKIAGAKSIQLGSDPTRNRLQLAARIAPAYASANDPWRELVTWKSSNKKIATVDSTGCVQALKAGTVKITCGLADGTKKRASVTIKITQKKPKAITMSDQVVPMLRNLKLNYAIAPDDAYDQRITWKTSDSRIAMVSSDGFVRGLKPGRVVISATTATGGKRASCTLTVVESAPATPSPSPSATPDPSPSASPDPSASPSASPSPTPTPPPKYRVHAIGNGTYLRSTNMGNLESAVPDAQTFADLYGAAKFSDGGTAVSLHKNLTGAQMLSLFSGMATGGATEDSVTILYFQGHSLSSEIAERHGALMGVDGGIVTVSELRALLDAVPGKIALIIDANFSGRFLEETGQAAVKFMQRAVAQTFTGDKYKLICACSATGFAYDMGGVASQTSLLMAAIKQGLEGSMPSDVNKNGRVTLAELHAFAKSAVDQIIADMNKFGLSLQQSVQISPPGDGMEVYAK